MGQVHGHALSHVGCVEGFVACEVGAEGVAVFALEEGGYYGGLSGGFFFVGGGGVIATLGFVVFVIVVSRNCQLPTYATEKDKKGKKTVTPEEKVMDDDRVPGEPPA